MKTRTFYFGSYGAISVEPRADLVPFTLQQLLDGKAVKNGKASMHLFDPKIVVDRGLESFHPEIWTVTQFEDMLLEL